MYIHVYMICYMSQDSTMSRSRRYPTAIFQRYALAI